MALLTTPTSTRRAGIVCMLIALYYMSDGCIRASEYAQRWIRYAFNTGTAFSLIRRNVLPQGCQNAIATDHRPRLLNDASSNPLDLREVVLLTTRFGNMLFRIKFIVAEKMAVDAIVGTAFMNQHVHVLPRQAGS